MKQDHPDRSEQTPLRAHAAGRAAPLDALLPGLVATLRAQLPNLLAVYLFGSHAKGMAHAASDIDLAVRVAGKVDPLRLWDLAQPLALRADCDVDLVDLRAASTVMQYQVVTTGPRLWECDAQAAIYESMILSEKTELDTARAGLLSDIQRRGTVYGRE